MSPLSLHPMALVAMLSHQLEMVAPALSAFVREGGLQNAAFRGDGGVYVLYCPRMRIPGPPLFYICTMRERPVLIETDVDDSADWVVRDTGIAVTRALAEAIIRPTQRGSRWLVTDADADLALAKAVGPVEWMSD